MYTSHIFFPSKSWTIYLGTHSLPPGGYVLQYNASTWYGGRALGNVTFFVANLDAPVLHPIRVPDTIFRNQIIQFSASVVFSDCSIGAKPVYIWQVRDFLNQLVLTGSQKTLTVPRYTFQLAQNNTYFVNFTVNTFYTVSTSFELSHLLPVAVISGGELITISKSGGRISAETSYNPNFAANEKQPPLSFLWNCTGFNLANIKVTSGFLDIPAISNRIICSVTVSIFSVSGNVSNSAHVQVVPVFGSPPRISITSSLSRVALNQNLALSVRVSSGVDSQYRFVWSSSKILQAADALTSLQSPSLLVKAAFFADVTSQVEFFCRVTDKITNVDSQTSISINVNFPPACGNAVLSISSDNCLNVGDSCIVKAMNSKVQVEMVDAAGALAKCNDGDSPISYQLLSFTTSCDSSSKGRVLSSSSLPSFSSIQIANGVKSLGIDAVDSLGASFRLCSQVISVKAAADLELTGLFQNANNALVGDSEGQKMFVSNVAGSLAHLYAASDANTNRLDTVKALALSFLNSSTSVSLTDAADAILTASSLHALVVLPGSMSSDQTALAVSMFNRFSASSMQLLVSGTATINFAIEVSPMLVEGSLNVFRKSLLSKNSRLLLGYQSGLDTAYTAVVAAAKIQAFSAAASQDAFVIEDTPYLVYGVRRLRSASVMASIIPLSSFLRVAVSVAPDADASSVVDVGTVVVVQSKSPYTDTSSISLISPTVAVASFDAGNGNEIPAIRNVVEVRFPVSQSSHDARIVVNGLGQRKAEGCVVYDGTRWLQSCVVGVYSSATSSITCTCNMTVSTLAIAAAEFVVDCSGAVGGSLSLDKCNTCGGSVTDAAKCTPNSNSDSPSSLVIIGGTVGGCLFFIFILWSYIRHQKREQIRQKGKGQFKDLVCLPADIEAS
jgi:hypothetical protein